MERLIVLTYLGTLDPVYSPAKPEIMGSSVVSFLPETSFVVSFLSETSFLEDCCVIEVTPDTTTTASNRSVLAAQGRQTAGGRGGDRADMEGR